MYKKGDGVLASAESKEERVLLLESWLAMEEGLGDAGDAEAIRGKLPRQIRKKRPIQACAPHRPVGGASWGAAPYRPAPRRPSRPFAAVSPFPCLGRRPCEGRASHRLAPPPLPC